jgi:hypothetical protein
VRRSVLAAGSVLALAPLLVLAACPSLGEIVVGSPRDASADHGLVRPSEGGTDVRIDDAGVDAPCDADVGADPRNCGYCRHDCLGGGCTGGACEPVVLYSGGTPMNIVVDGPTLFVTVTTVSPDDGYVFRCTAASCQATATVLAAGLASPWFAVKESAAVYWANFGGADTATDPGSVMGCPETGCPDAGPRVYTPEGGGAEGGINIAGLAADETYLYWAATFSSGYNGAIYRCVTTECAGTIAELGSGFGFSFEVVVDSSYVYWIDVGPNHVLRCALPSCGGGPEFFADLAGSPKTIGLSGLALYGGSVFWTEGVADGGVFYCPTSGCGTTPTAIATGQADPEFVAADESGVYWSNGGNGTVMHCPIAGCAKPVAIATVAAPYAIALDAVSVYFTSSSAVLRVAK